MDSKDTKQIVIGYYSLKSGCKAMLKLVRINLNDAETAMKMSKAQKDTLEDIKHDCKSIQKVVRNMERFIDDLEESLFNNGTDLEAVTKSILGIKQ